MAKRDRDGKTRWLGRLGLGNLAGPRPCVRKTVFLVILAIELCLSHLLRQDQGRLAGLGKLDIMIYSILVETSALTPFLSSHLNDYYLVITRPPGPNCLTV